MFDEAKKEADQTIAELDKDTEPKYVPCNTEQYLDFIASTLLGVVLLLAAIFLTEKGVGVQYFMGTLSMAFMFMSSISLKRILDARKNQ